MRPLCAAAGSWTEPLENLTPSAVGGRRGMDGRRFDDLTRALGAPGSRRGFLKGLLGASLAAAGLGRFAGSDADAQVSQVYCGNQFCASNPGGCKPGCVCCTYTN